MDKKFKIYNRKIRLHGILTLNLMCVYVHVCIFYINGIFHEIFLLLLPMYVYIYRNIYCIFNQNSVIYKLQEE